MRNTPNLRIDRYRKVHPVLGDSEPGQNWGYFEIPRPSGTLRIIAMDANEEYAKGWEHVSVSLNNRTPTWEEMCLVKDLFWKDEEDVFQFHPPKSDYVNFHEHCLHLWRDVLHKMHLPPSEFVGPFDPENHAVGGGEELHAVG